MPGLSLSVSPEEPRTLHAGAGIIKLGETLWRSGFRVTPARPG